MSTIKKTLTAVIIATSLLGAGSAMAWGGGMHRGGGAGFCGNMQNLNLTQAQKAQLNDMRQHHQQNFNDTNWQQQRENMQTLMQQKNFDETKARALINEQQKVRTDRQVQFLKDRHAFYQSLTEAQKKTFNDNCAKNMDRAKAPRGNRSNMNSKP